MISPGDAMALFSALSDDRKDWHKTCNGRFAPRKVGRLGRLQMTMSHVSGRMGDCALCPQDCAAHEASSIKEEAAKARRSNANLGGESAHFSTSAFTKAEEFPIMNPYCGRIADLDEIGRIHKELEEDQASSGGGDQQLGPNAFFDSLRKEGKLQGAIEAAWPFVSRGSGQDGVNPHWESEELAAATMPCLEQFVANIKRGEPTMYAEPHVMLPYSAYCDPKRFDAEVETFRSGVVIAGFTSDLPDPNDFRRFEAFGKSVLLTRDSDGVFHAFENMCRHRGAELVPAGEPKGNRPLVVCPYHSWSYGTDGALMGVPFEHGFDESAAVGIKDRNLIELPATEKAGILFVIAVPDAAAEAAIAGGESPRDYIERVVAAETPPGLLSELELQGLGKHHCIVEQTVRMPCNWKLGIDTFGETYHFSSLHPGLSQAFVSGIQVLRTFGEGKAGKNACMTLGRFTLDMIAKGEVPEAKWRADQPLLHLLQVYHLAPNVVLNVGGDNFSFFQFWPGNGVDESYCTVRLYNYRKPETREQLLTARAEFHGLMQVVCAEDFPMLPRMQRNFKQNPNRTIVFGRNEPALQNRHTYFENAVAGKY